MDVKRIEVGGLFVVWLRAEWAILYTVMLSRLFVLERVRVQEADHGNFRSVVQ